MLTYDFELIGKRVDPSSYAESTLQLYPSLRLLLLPSHHDLAVWSYET